MPNKEVLPMSEVSTPAQEVEEFDPTESAFMVLQQTIRMSGEVPRPAQPVDLAKLKGEEDGIDGSDEDDDNK